MYFHNNNYGSNLEYKDLTTWDLHDIWNTSSEEAQRRSVQFVLSEHHKDINTIEGSTESLLRLKEHFELVVITARDKKYEHKAHELIEKHFKDMFSSVHFLYDNDIKIGTKGELCKKLSVDYFVDDSISNVKNTADEGIKTFLFDTPWNTECDDERIVRVRSWKELEEFLLKDVS